jgi:hypothetical protein
MATRGKRPRDREAQRDSEPSFEVDENRIGEGYFVRVTFPDGKTEAVYGFATRADAIKWVRCEAIVWLWEHQTKTAAIAG